MMQVTRFKFLTALVLLLTAFISNASSVYKVSKGDKFLYLGGTIHILTADDYPLASPYQEAFEQAKEVYFETDIAALNSPEFQQQTLPVILQPQGQTLNAQLSPEVQTQLQTYLDSRGIPAAQIQALRPAGAMLVLTITEFQLRGFTQPGVDDFFFNKATENKKHIGWLESVESQLDLIKGFNDMDPDALIKYTLEDVSKGDEMILSLHEAWRKGDLSGLFAAGMDSWIDEYPKVYQNIMVDRNNAWYPQIVNMLKDDDVEFVLVGALHLAGEDGLIHLLEQDGYKVEKFTP
ncbi:TraB/GumN family protein [Glaciecola sp. 1036]|uniref:TraB/GumN family protein n=1 Tax=Alteromonadaceae TaxID=72275 RepID=UPI003D06EF3A